MLILVLLSACTNDNDNIIYGDTETIYADDREILIKFYHDTGGDNWERNDNWCSEKPIDEWYGVDVDDNGRVWKISLGPNSLKGKGTLSGCTALTRLSCWDNQLTSLDVSGCTALVILSCQCNQLTSLDVSGCTALERLDCYINQLTSLDVSGCTALWYLDCRDNQLTQEITGIFAEIDSFLHDERYKYYRDADGLIQYRDRGKGWWYPGEPGKGYHGE